MVAAKGFRGMPAGTPVLDPYDLPEIAGRNVVVVQTKCHPATLYLLGQAFFAKVLLLEGDRPPAAVRCWTSDSPRARSVPSNAE